ncbi:MAG TPA: GntR family transcriptional regulator [Sphingomonadaceae bacterium]|nr:GntR family transcriptional regulator [Sphingomonadaceae bacterium]
MTRAPKSAPTTKTSSDTEDARIGRAFPSHRRLQRSPGFVEEVFDIIRADIMSLRIPPDSRISIDQLARELGVSQTPIREALSMLEAIGLVARRHYVGYWSAPQLTRKQIDDLYEVRLLLEPYAARLAAHRMTDAQLARIASAIDTMDPGKITISYDQFADCDAELHDMIAAGSGNTIIQESLARLHSHLHIFRLRSNNKVASEANLEHVALLDALVKRDGDAAEIAMRHHIERSYARLTSDPQH